MHKKTINILARRQRHAGIDFKSGALYKNKKETLQVFIRFYLKIILYSCIFFILYFLTKYYTLYYVEAPDTFTPSTSIDAYAKEVYILGDNGFVTKPSLQTKKGDLLTSNEVLLYTIEAGDTIYGIAAKFNLNIQTILQNNSSLSQWSILKLGKEIKILPIDGLLYTPKEKESIASIAKNFNIKEEVIIRQNSITENKEITGIELIIPGAKKKVRITKTLPIKTPSIYTGAISGNFIWPANASITQYYKRGHYALDIANRKKGPILASASGVVISAKQGWNGGYGNMIIIDHGNGFKTLYAHNEKLYVQVGDNVTQGATIAWMGRSGRVRGVTGIHLHFEIIYNGVKKNPLSYIGYR
jgi:murein DD-endopeptidase MepM/ murein hydrolase activator NlpD